MSIKKRERKMYELTCIAPVHIGNGELLKQFEYIHEKNRNEEKVYFLDQKKWMSYLMRHQWIDDYAQEILRRRCVLGQWLRNKTHTSNLRPVIREICNSSADVYTTKDSKKHVNDIVRQVKTIDGVPYIPGSSLKGAVRSAILFHCIRQNHPAYQPYWQELKRVMVSVDKRTIGNRSIQRTINRNIQTIVRKMERHTFSKLNLDLDRPNDALESIMRGILISDAMMTEKKRDTIVLEKYDVSKKRGKSIDPHTVALFRECIPVGRRLRFSIIIDTDMTSRIGLTSLDMLWQWMRDYIQFGLEAQQSVFGRQFRAEFKESQLADLLIGGGTGFFSKTIYYALASEREGKEVLASFFDYVLFSKKNRQTRRLEPAHHHLRDDDVLTPRTLKLAYTGGDRWILGLASVKDVTEC